MRRGSERGPKVMCDALRDNVRYKGCGLYTAWRSELEGGRNRHALRARTRGTHSGHTFGAHACDTQVLREHPPAKQQPVQARISTTKTSKRRSLLPRGSLEGSWRCPANLGRVRPKRAPRVGVPSACPESVPTRGAECAPLVLARSARPQCMPRVSAATAPSAWQERWPQVCAPHWSVFRKHPCFWP